MKAKVNKSYAGPLVRAFGGHEYVRFEYRDVPEGCDAEAHRLEEYGLIELQDNSPPVIPVGLAALRAEAKEAGISHYWQKKPERLIDELYAIEEEE